MTNDQIAAKGNELEHAPAKDCVAFARKNQSSDDAAVRALAHIALFSASAKGHRLAGRIDEAMIYEGYIDSLYNSLPKGARW